MRAVRPVFGQSLDPSISPSLRQGHSLLYFAQVFRFLSCQVLLYRSGLRGLFVVYTFMQID